MIARAEMGGDNELVLEPLLALQEIIQVHVAELVDLLAAMVGPNETHLGDEDFRLENWRIVIQSGGAGVARVRQKRGADLAGNLRAPQPQIADLVAGQPLE